MALLTVRPNGLSLTEPASIDRPVTFGRRGIISGWSRQASQRHKRWLQSVDAAQLEGLHGVAITLTTRLMPDGPEALYRTLERWWKRQQVRGAQLGHWVRENHADGRPHYHLGLFFDHKLSKLELAQLVRDWVECAAELRPAAVGQDAKPMDHAGWAKYCAKHSARSVNSYQRTGMPAGWSRCGRLWGHWGDWPTLEDVYAIDQETCLVLRRMLLAWRRGDAAAAVATARRALVSARSERGRRQAQHHVKCAEGRQAAVAQMEANATRTRRGISEWTARPDALDFLRRAADEANGVVVLVGETVDADGVVQPWRVIRGRDGDLGVLPVPDGGEWDELPNALTPDRDALLALHSPTEPSADSIAAGVMFRQERNARRAGRRRAQGDLRTRWQRDQHRAVAQPGITVGRRDASRQLLGL